MGFTEADVEFNVLQQILTLIQVTAGSDLIGFRQANQEADTFQCIAAAAYTSAASAHGHSLWVDSIGQLGYQERSIF